MKSFEYGRGNPGPDYRLRESARARRLSIRVSPHAGVEVVMPRGTSVREAERLVRERRDWINRAVSRLEARGMARWRRPVSVPERIDFSAVGLSLPVQWRAANTPCVRLAGRQTEACVEIHSTAPDELPVAALHRWLLGQGRQHLVPWLETLARDRGLDYSRVRIAGQRTLWGSCSARGTISLNYRLLFLPPRLCRYVLVHELCHLLHRDHSRRFWHRLETLLPGALRLDNELRTAGALVPDWVESFQSSTPG